MVKHVIYGFFGFLSACAIAFALYFGDSDAKLQVATPDEAEEVEGQEASVAIAGSSAEYHEVVRVIDGDTISIRKDGALETVRFIGINAPETAQCYSAEATQKLKSLLGSGGVALELDQSQGERDKYDRLLAYVFTESGVNAAKALIEGGFAKEYTYSRAYKYQSEFKAAQAAAQAAGKGLWAPGACPAITPAPAQITPQPVVAPTPTPAPVQQTQATKKTEPVEEPEEKEDKPEPEPEPEEEEEEESEEYNPPPASSGSYTCSSNTYNCSDFSTHAEAQAVYEACGGVANDVHKLDANKDGQACESLP